MIKFEHKTQPLWWQVDTSYNLPSSTGPVQWNGERKQFEVQVSGMWRPIDNTISVVNDPELAECVRWIKDKIREEKELEQLRREHQTLDDAYKHAEFIKTLVKNHDI
jgi:hypothetical protein